MVQAFLLFLTLVAAGCARQISTTELRLIARSEGGRTWVEVTAPPQALPINDWVKKCPGNVSVLYQSPRVVSLGCTGEAPEYASFRLEDGRRLVLRDTIQRGVEGQLQEAVNRYLRKKNRGAFIPGDSFSLTAQGMVFPTPEGDVIVSSIEMRPLLSPEAALLVGR
jgi:hypothetical protein